ncbi:MAG: SRPBCC family protein, partial [Pseudomonadota bacterium]
LIREIIGLDARKSAFLDAEIAHSPIGRYASPERFARERKALLRRRPTAVLRSEELEGRRAFAACDVMGLPALITRDDAGEVRAFLNVCRHRGARLEREATGCKRVFTCPYHGWSWSNDGALRAVPQEAQGFPDLPRAERGLRRLPAAEAHGFIWLVADPGAGEAPDLSGWLGGLEADLSWLDLAGHRIASDETLEIAANWKVLVEGGLEAYHFRVAHAGTIAPYFPDNLSTYRMFGPHIRSVLPRRSLMDLRDRAEESWSIRRDANLLYTLMPTTQLLVQQDHVVWLRAAPLSEARTELRIVTLAPAEAARDPEMRAHWARNHAITLATLREDFELGEEIQAGFASRGNPSHLFGRFEGALNRFNLAVEELLAG